MPKTPHSSRGWSPAGWSSHGIGSKGVWVSISSPKLRGLARVLDQRLEGVALLPVIRRLAPPRIAIRQRHAELAQPVQRLGILPDLLPRRVGMAEAARQRLLRNQAAQPLGTALHPGQEPG